MISKAIYDLVYSPLHAQILPNEIHEVSNVPENEDTPDDLEQSTEWIQHLYTEFLSQMGYKPSNRPFNMSLFEAMGKRADELGVPHPEGSHSETIMKVGVTYADHCYPDHPMEIKVYVGLLTWIAVLLDDKTSCRAKPEDVSKFPQRFLTNQPQPTPLLEIWAQVIRESYVYYDPFIANLIITAILNGCICFGLEDREEYHRMKRTPTGSSWAYFLRCKDGIAEAYVLFAFPKATYPDFSVFLEAVPDMANYINTTNDLLSFYKEDKMGERHNYIRSRCYYENKPPSAVLKDVAKEALVCHHRVSQILQHRGKYADEWQKGALGYISYHMVQPRYRLAELGF